MRCILKHVPSSCGAIMLQQQEVTLSGNCRQMISDVAANEFPLDEDVNNVQLLIDGMYNANASMTEHNVDKCLELARKYDVADMHDNCAHFLVAVPLTVQNLPRWLALAAAYNVDAALQKCQAFVAAGDNFKAIVRSVRRVRSR